MLQLAPECKARAAGLIKPLSLDLKAIGQLEVTVARVLGAIEVSAVVDSCTATRLSTGRTVCA